MADYTTTRNTQSTSALSLHCAISPVWVRGSKPGADFSQVQIACQPVPMDLSAFLPDKAFPYKYSLSGPCPCRISLSLDVY